MARRYPPLAAVVVALMLALFALPSALNLPLANPGQTLEYAPVPGNGNQAPPGGNLAGLSLGAGGNANGAIGGGGQAGAAPPPPPPTTAASAKRCVGTPPRQTEDPVSPPCVAAYSGNNGGATYKGVTATEIRVLFYADAQFTYNNCNSQQPPPATYYDMEQPQSSSENTCLSPILRTWQREFNTRYQTYNRFVHFYLYFSGAGANSNAPTPEQRRADAVDNLNHVHPFAVIPLLDFTFGNLQAYETAMLSSGVFVFTKEPFEPSSYFSQYAPLLWGYAPSLEEQAKNFVSYVCSTVVNQATDFAGTVPNGQPRVYGLIETTDPRVPNLQQFQKTVVQQVEACGVTFKATANYPVDGYAGYASNDPNQNSYAASGMATFKQQRVTTIIWPGGYETGFSNAAEGIGYEPEWVIAGDGNNDSFDGAHFQNAKEWSLHTSVVTTVERIPSSGVSNACTQAFTDADSNTSDYDTYRSYACDEYASIRQLFTGIQVAGPRLAPSTVDQGYHAIPPYLSSDPQQPACYYDQGDYTCTKDAQASYWDETGTTANTAGCYRMVQGGARYTPGRWPSGNVADNRTSNDPCNNDIGGAVFSGSVSTP